MNPIIQSLQQRGISLEKLAIISLLYRESTATMGGIALQINRTSASTTGLIKALVKDGTVRQHIAKHDKRLTFVSLTNKGFIYALNLEEDISHLAKAAGKEVAA